MESIPAQIPLELQPVYRAALNSCAEIFNKLLDQPNVLALKQLAGEHAKYSKDLLEITAPRTSAEKEEFDKRWNHIEGSWMHKMHKIQEATAPRWNRLLGNDSDDPIKLRQSHACIVAACGLNLCTIPQSGHTLCPGFTISHIDESLTYSKGQETDPSATYTATNQNLTILEAIQTMGREKPSLY